MVILRPHRARHPLQRVGVIYHHAVLCSLSLFKSVDQLYMNPLPVTLHHHQVCMMPDPIIIGVVVQLLHVPIEVPHHQAVHDALITVSTVTQTFDAHCHQQVIPMDGKAHHRQHLVIQHN
jgi:hypothetical protein